VTDQTSQNGQEAPGSAADVAHLIHDLLAFRGLPPSAAADAEPIAAMAQARRAAIRALDVYVQQAPHPIEPMTTPNWMPHDD
jgi:hypothetical protein